MIRIRFILFFSLLLFCRIGNSNENLSSKIFELIYNNQFHEAANLLEANKDNLDNFQYTILEIDLSYWKNILASKPADFEAFENTIKKYHLQETTTQDQKITQLIFLSYKLRYELKRYKFHKALATQHKTKIIYEDLKNANTIHTELQQNLLVIYGALIEYFDNYWMRFINKKKKQNSLQALQKIDQFSTSEYKSVSTLAAYLTGKIYLKYENKPEHAKSYFQVLKINYPNNCVFIELFQECESKSGK